MGCCGAKKAAAASETATKQAAAPSETTKSAASEPSNPWPWICAGISQEHYDHIVTEFASLDLDGDQKLQRTEFEQAAQLPEFLNMQPDDVAHLFDKVDVDHNGQISFKEFLDYMATRKDHQPLASQVSPQMESVKANMEALGYELCLTYGDVTQSMTQGVPGDGNCQFYSLSWHLYQTTGKHAEVRSAIIDYLRGPRGADVSVYYVPEFPAQPPTFEGYLDLMSNDCSWGDQLTLKAAADIFKVCIHVITADQYDPAAKPAVAQLAGRSYGCVSTLLPDKADGHLKDIWISFAAQHYNPIVQKKG